MHNDNGSSFDSSPLPHWFKANHPNLPHVRTQPATVVQRRCRLVAVDVHVLKSMDNYQLAMVL
jgi:hypothetical protein